MSRNLKFFRIKFFILDTHSLVDFGSVHYDVAFFISNRLFPLVNLVNILFILSKKYLICSFYFLVSISLVSALICMLSLLKLPLGLNCLCIPSILKSNIISLYLNSLSFSNVSTAAMNILLWAAFIVLHRLLHVELALLFDTRHCLIYLGIEFFLIFDLLYY